MRVTRLTLSILALGAFAACNEASGPEATALSAEEARAVALALDAAGTSAMDAEPAGPSLSLSPSAPALDVITRTDDFALSFPCALGGTASVDGERTVVLDTDAGSIRVELTATGAYDGCRVRTRDADAVEVRLDGSVAFEADRELSSASGATGTHRYIGSIAYSTSEGKEGSCAVDLTTTFSAVTGSATRTVVGTVCDHPVEATTSWSWRQS